MKENNNTAPFNISFRNILPISLKYIVAIARYKPHSILCQNVDPIFCPITVQCTKLTYFFMWCGFDNFNLCEDLFLAEGLFQIPVSCPPQCK